MTSAFIRRHREMPLAATEIAIREMVDKSMADARKATTHVHAGPRCLCREEGILIVCAIRVARMTGECVNHLVDENMHDLKSYLAGLS